MLRATKPIFRCECIDGESLADMKIALATARDTYQDIAKNLRTASPEFIKSVENLEDNARRFDILADEISKIKPCISDHFRK